MKIRQSTPRNNDDTVRVGAVLHDRVASTPIADCQVRVSLVTHAALARGDGRNQLPGDTILKLIKADHGSVYDAPNHFGMWGTRKFGPPEGAKAVNVSISEFLPNGGATMSSSDKERVYCVLRGSITVTEEGGTKHRVDADDMIYIAPGEKRSVATNGDVAARVLVIVVSC